jgi:hypothetical protein
MSDEYIRQLNDRIANLQAQAAHRKDVIREVSDEGGLNAYILRTQSMNGEIEGLATAIRIAAHVLPEPEHATETPANVSEETPE